MEYFLTKLARSGDSPLRPAVFSLVVNMARRSFDAVSALRAIRLLQSPFPLWALTTRNTQMLLEAPLWLGDIPEFHRVWEELHGNADTGAQVREWLLDYLEIARDREGATQPLKDRLVLPALHWERLTRSVEFEHWTEETGYALRQALRFVPGTDPRRAELVVRLLEVEAAALPDFDSQVRSAE